MLTSLSSGWAHVSCPHRPAPGERGPSWRYSYTGGDSAALRYRPTRKQGLQGLRFAPGGAGQRAECLASAGVGGIVGAQKVRTSVRNGFAGLHSRRAKTASVENSMLVRVCRCSTPANREIGRRDIGCKGLQKLDTLGLQSDHAIHPLASVVVRQHHIQAELFAQHAGNRPTHGVRLPAGRQHQLQAGCALRAA